MLYPNHTKQVLKYIIGDLLAINVGWVMFNLFRYELGTSSVGYKSLTDFLFSDTLILGQLFFPLFFIIIFAISGYYQTPLLKSRVNEFFLTILSIIIGTIAIYFMILDDDLTVLNKTGIQLLCVMIILLFFFTYTIRLCITSVATHKIHRRTWGIPTVVIGTGVRAQQLIKELNSMRFSLGYNIIGAVSSPFDNGCQITQVPILGSINDIKAIKESTPFKEIIIAIDTLSKSKLHATVNILYALDCPIKIMVQNSEMAYQYTPLSNIYGTPLVDISTCRLSAFEKNMKRIFDIIIASVGLVLLIPLFITVAIIIKREDHGNIFYTQERIGYHRKRFNIIKFRSMIHNAENNGPALSSPYDPRITKTGHYLRKYRIDELPQLVNVLIGNMSIVGPRPERIFFIEQIEKQVPYINLLFQVRPGITSWGMVKFGYAQNVKEMIERLNFEILYIENISILVDIKIIIYTIRTVFTGKGI